MTQSNELPLTAAQSDDLTATFVARLKAHLASPPTKPELDLPPGHPSFITRVLGVDSGRFRVGQARRARSHQVAQAPDVLLLAFGCPARNVA